MNLRKCFWSMLWHSLPLAGFSDGLEMPVVLTQRHTAHDVASKPWGRLDDLPAKVPDQKPDADAALHNLQLSTAHSFTGRLSKN